MPTRPLGRSGPRVSILGYGAMPLSLAPEVPEPLAEQTLRQVLEAGVTLIDTADTYCLSPDRLHHNERLVARVVREVLGPEHGVCIATKGGTVRTGSGWLVDGSPERILESIRASHAALGGCDPIPLWQHHWPDPRHSISSVMQAVRQAVDEHLVRFVGVANYSVEQIMEARRHVDVVSVQNQLNFWRRESETVGVLRYCEAHGLAFLPWRPMGGSGLAQRLGEIGPLAEMSGRLNASPNRLVVAWLLAKSPCILPIPGSARTAHILDCLQAADLAIDRTDFDILDNLDPSVLPRRDRPAAWRDMPPLSSRTTPAI